MNFSRLRSSDHCAHFYALLLPYFVFYFFDFVVQPFCMFMWPSFSFVWEWHSDMQKLQFLSTNNFVSLNWMRFETEHNIHWTSSFIPKRFYAWKSLPINASKPNSIFLLTLIICRKWKHHSWDNIIWVCWWNSSIGKENLKDAYSFLSYFIDVLL